MPSSDGNGRKRAADTSEQFMLDQHQPPTRRLRPLESIYQAHVQSEIEDLKAALEHERSLRGIDQRRSRQIQQRLERQVQFAVEEAQEAKALLEELRESSEEEIARLRDSRMETLRQLRSCQEELMEAQVEAAESFHEDLLASRDAMIHGQLEAKNEEIAALRQELTNVTEVKIAELSHKQNEVQKEPEYKEGAISPAPKEVMRELNRVRIQLAESERKFRQLRRKSDEWHQRANDYVREKEANRSATTRLFQLEQELRELRKQYELSVASNTSWKEFSHKLCQVISKELPVTAGPPEIATVLRHLETSRRHTQQLEDDKTKLQESLKAFEERIAALKVKLTQEAAISEKASQEKKQVEGQLESVQYELKTLRAQEGIWRREADSLRDLLKTFDDLPGAIKDSSTVKSQELSLATAKGENQVLTEDRDRLIEQVASLQKARQEQQKEHELVVEKFGKLREALYTEKQRVIESESRACQAEALAGKGSFNTEESRALHLARNPLTEAMRERYETETRALQRQLEESTGENHTPAPASTLEVDPHKLHQRLKQSFKEQIALFREGVYLMTGYKVDMLPGAASDKPIMFRVRSVYAEREHDHLLFVCKKSGEEVTGLDLAETDFTKLLSTTDSHEYLTKFNSIPGFLASVQLSLLEKQTFAVS